MLEFLCASCHQLTELRGWQGELVLSVDSVAVVAAALLALPALPARDKRTNMMKLETRIPAGFIGGLTALIPQVGTQTNTLSRGACEGHVVGYTCADAV